MKILLINHAPLTGTGSGTYNAVIANALIRKGHEVRVIVPDNILVKENIAHPVYFNGFNKQALPFNFPVFTTSPRSSVTFGDLTDEQLQEYMEVFRKAIKEEIETFKPDLIHSSHIWLLSDMAGDFGLPLVITAHGTDLLGYNKWPKFRESAENATKKANKIIVISDDNAKLTTKTFPEAKDKIKLIKNGYDPEIFYKENYNREQVLKELGIDGSYKKIVSFAGKFTHFKGIDLLLKAAKEYEKDDILTIICGYGELFDDMKNLATELKLKNVKFLGNQPHDVLRKVYNIADVSLVPSRNEAFGLVVIEAMACGTPVIGTNQGGIPEIINDKVGLLFEPENYHDLADKIMQVLNEKVTFDSDYIAKYVYDNYSEDELIKPLIEVYEEALK